MTYIQKSYFLNFDINRFLDLSTLVLNSGVGLKNKTHGKFVKMCHELTDIFWDA